MSNLNPTLAADQSQARDAALGPVSGPCCDPAADPCTTCLVPDVEPYEPTEEDWADYREFCREHDDKIWAERIAADSRRNAADARLADAVFEALREAHEGGLQSLLADLCNAFRDHETSEDVRFVGGLLGTAYDLARHLEARSGEQYVDRRDAMLDAIECNR